MIKRGSKIFFGTTKTISFVFKPASMFTGHPISTSKEYLFVLSLHREKHTFIC